MFGETGQEVNHDGNTFALEWLQSCSPKVVHFWMHTWMHLRAFACVLVTKGLSHQNEREEKEIFLSKHLIAAAAAGRSDRN